MGLEKQGSKSTGYIGKVIGKLMNIMHTDLYIKYFQNDLPSEKSKILDIGCGGGKFIKFLSDTNDSYMLFGLDHSPEMVELSKKVNKQAIDNKQVVIIQGSIANILVKKASYDLITAFETIQFWPNIDRALVDIEKLLNIGGSFLIINRYQKEGSKWWKMANIKSDQEYKDKLEKAGLSDITIDLDFKKGWIIVKVTKT